jgi:hypothetical protein
MYDQSLEVANETLTALDGLEDATAQERRRRTVDRTERCGAMDDER